MFMKKENPSSFFFVDIDLGINKVNLKVAKMKNEKKNYLGFLFT